MNGPIDTNKLINNISKDYAKFMFNRLKNSSEKILRGSIFKEEPSCLFDEETSKFLFEHLKEMYSKHYSEKLKDCTIMLTNIPNITYVNIGGVENLSSLEIEQIFITIFAHHQKEFGIADSSLEGVIVILLNEGFPFTISCKDLQDTELITRRFNSVKKIRGY